MPDSAIVSEQTRKILFLVGDDNKVAPRPVTIGPIVDGLRAIRSGLNLKDKVIILRLASPMVRPGAIGTPQAGQIKPVTN